LTLTVTLVVLAAALMHATWNTIIKATGQVSNSAWLIAGAGALWTLFALPFVPFPAREAWPYLAGSLVIHVVYYYVLVAVYRAGDLSFTYPIMRGLPPLIVTLAAMLWLAEHPTTGMWFGIATVCVGILVIGSWWQANARNPRAAAWAVLNACIIASYTLLDAQGTRLAGHPLSYIVWLMFLEGVPFAFLLWRAQRGHFVDSLRATWRRGLFGGFCNVFGYGLVLWATTQAPVGAVAALRETSVIFAAVLGAVVLREPFGRMRIVGACLVALGVALVRG